MPDAATLPLESNAALALVRDAGGENEPHPQHAIYLGATKPSREWQGFEYLVELGGFEPPSASLLRADLHV